MISHLYSGKFNPEEAGELKDGSAVPFTPGKSGKQRTEVCQERGVISDFHQEQLKFTISVCTKKNLTALRDKNLRYLSTHKWSLHS